MMRRRYWACWWRVTWPISASRITRSLEVDRDAVALHVVCEASFASNPDYEPISFEAFCDEHLRACDLHAELSSVALSDGSVIGPIHRAPRQSSTPPTSGATT
jgi:hypothetical protein